MKRCRVCDELKPLEDFYKMAGMRDGHRNECKACNLAVKRARYDSADAVARVERWRRANPERYAAYQSEYRNRPGRKRDMRDRYYRRTYGISADEFDAILEKQGGVCAICCGPDPTHLDHDHETGAIRGILCVNCNQGLGKFRDDPDLLERAASYLRAG